MVNPSADLRNKAAAQVKLSRAALGAGFTVATKSTHPDTLPKLPNLGNTDAQCDDFAHHLMARHTVNCGIGG